jgi:hypothetical protein
MRRGGLRSRRQGARDGVFDEHPSGPPAVSLIITLPLANRSVLYQIKRACSCATLQSATRSRQVLTALLLYVLMRFLCVISGRNHPYQVVTLLRAAPAVPISGFAKILWDSRWTFRYLATRRMPISQDRSVTPWTASQPDSEKYPV